MAKKTSKTQNAEQVPSETEQSQVAQVEQTTQVKKSKKSKAPKGEANASSTPIVSSETVAETQQSSVVAAHGDVDVVVEGEASLADMSSEFLAKLQHINNLISTLKYEYKTLEKRWSREIKTAQKVSTKRKRKSVNRAPSGFVKPTKISDELASFLGKEKGTEMARTEVTRDINKYIRTNNLQDKENGRKINPDSKLAALLKLKKTDELTYFNLQRYMSPHFAKATKEATA